MVESKKKDKFDLGVKGLRNEHYKSRNESCLSTAPVLQTPWALHCIGIADIVGLNPIQA